MKLIRKGSRRDTRKPEIIFDKRAMVFVHRDRLDLEFYSVDDKDGKSKYTYKLQLSRKEVAKILQQVVLDTVDD